MTNRMLTLQFSVRIPKHERIRYTLRVPLDLEADPKEIMGEIMERTLTVPGLMWGQVLQDYVPGLLIPEMRFHAEAQWEGVPGTRKPYNAPLCSFTADIKSESIDEQILSGIVATFGQRVFMFVLAEQPE